MVFARVPGVRVFRAECGRLRHQHVARIIPDNADSAFDCIHFLLGVVLAAVWTSVVRAWSARRGLMRVCSGAYMPMRAISL